MTRVPAAIGICATIVLGSATSACTSGSGNCVAGTSGNCPPGLCVGSTPGSTPNNLRSGGPR